MHLYFDGFSDETIHVASFRGEQFIILSSDDVVMIETMFGNRWFVGLNQSHVSFMFFNAELDGPYALSDVRLATFTKDPVYAWCS